MGAPSGAPSARGSPSPVKRMLAAGDAVGPGEAGGAHQARDGVGEQDVVVVEEQQPVAAGRAGRGVAGGPYVAVLLADDAPAAGGEVGLDLGEGGQGRGAAAAVVDQDGVEVGVVLGEGAAGGHAQQLGGARGGRGRR